MADHKLQKSINLAIIACESSHIFCCVLPTLFSVISLMAGLGIAVMPVWLESLHENLHDWEIPMLTLSGVVIALGWGLDYIARKNEVHAEGCHHEDCDTKGKTSNLILKVATVLFLVNALVYVTFHYQHDQAREHTSHHESLEHHHH